MLDNPATDQNTTSFPDDTTQFSFEDRLYKKHLNGTIGDYHITVTANHDGSATLSRSATKVIGGKPNTTLSLITEGKNIGKANETSPVEQAIKEAKTKVKGQLKKGYVTSLEDTDKPVSNQHGDPLPTLAVKFQDVKHIPFPVHLQRKFNGHRLISIIRDGLVHLYSREGTTVNMPHIQAELQTAYDTDIWDGTPLDGELYRDGWSLERISKMAKKLRPASGELTYHIYDVIAPTRPFDERLYALRKMFENIKTDNKLFCVETIIAVNQAEIDTLDKQFIEEGYEGTIVRLNGEGYVGGRCGQLIKLKQYHDDEFKVVGSKLGKPNYKGDNVYQLPIWILETKNGERFDCTAQGSIFEKHAFYEKGLERYYGKMLNVRYWELSERGVPPNSVAQYFINTL